MPNRKEVKELAQAKPPNPLTQGRHTRTCTQLSNLDLGEIEECEMWWWLQLIRRQFPAAKGSGWSPIQAAIRLGGCPCFALILVSKEGWGNGLFPFWVYNRIRRPRSRGKGIQPFLLIKKKTSNFNCILSAPQNQNLDKDTPLPMFAPCNPQADAIDCAPLSLITEPAVGRRSRLSAPPPRFGTFSFVDSQDNLYHIPLKPCPSAM